MFDKSKYLKYLYSSTWKDKRREALRLAGYRCCVCGTTNNLNVHHKHYKTLYRENPAEDLLVVCRIHHRMEHGIRNGLESKDVRTIPPTFVGYLPLGRRKRKSGTWRSIRKVRERT